MAGWRKASIRGLCPDWCNICFLPIMGWALAWDAVEDLYEFNDFMSENWYSSSATSVQFLVA